MKSKQFLLIAFIIAIFLSLNFGLKPYLAKQNAVKTAEEILNLWVNGDLMNSSVYWEKKQEYPPLYGILSYQITKKEFYREDENWYARISAQLKFTAENIYAEKKDWVFVLRRNIGSWKVVNFYSSDNAPEGT